MLKQGTSEVLYLLKMLIESTAGVLIYLKCQNKVWMGSYIVGNAKIRYVCGAAGVLHWSKKHK